MHPKKITHSIARLVFASLALLGLLLSLSVGPALAVHDLGLFQLDYTTNPQQGAANVSSTNISPAGNTGDDWDNVYKSVTGLGTVGPSNAIANAFVHDTTGASENSFFTIGGSKDTNDIPDWTYDTVNDQVPDKDDIDHAFAAAYAPTSGTHAGRVLLYFGADRFNTDGNAQLGFWFFREAVYLDPLAPGETVGTFHGQHSIGDILVLTDFVNGGQAGKVTIYKWVGGKDPLALVQDFTQADCANAPANDTICGVINNTPGEAPPWNYVNKEGESTYRQGALFEAGLDLNDVLGVATGGDIGCFGSFLAETRSSHATNAQLKDFALGSLPICGIKVTKTGDTLSKIGDPVDYTVTIENTGHSTLYKRNISDTLLGVITTDGVDQANPYVLTNTCGASLAPGATCTITLRRTVQAGDPDPLPNTVSILYSEKANFTGLEFPASDDHSVNLFQPAVKIEKTGDDLSKATDPVTYTFTITNMSSQDSPDLTLESISDNVIGDLKADATAAGCDTLTYNEVCSFTETRTVAGGDPDPLVNTVDVLYHPVGFPNNITATDGHSVNLFQPSVSIEKTGNSLSKIGDDVTYHFKITNTSSSDSPALKLDSINDDVLGDLSSYAGGCASLAPGASCEFDVPWTIVAVDIQPADGQADDPVINTVTIHFHPDGFTNDITATGSHELNLFQPSIAFSKTADTQLSKATDVVNYTITLNNTSSVDTPDMVCTITDAKLGVSKTVTLASGEGDVTNVPYTVQAGDPDPLVNNASVSCSPTGFPNVLTGSGSVSVNLFQPGVKVEKSGDTLSKIGDSVSYHFTITNTSSVDSPNLMLDSMDDTVLGSLTPPVTCDNMAPGASCSFDVPWTVAQNATDPTVNTVVVHYHPVGFTNDISSTASHSLNLFQPSITFDKTGDTLSKVGDDVHYTLTLNNTSSSDTPNLVCTITDAKIGVSKSVTLASGASDVTNKTYTVQPGDSDPLLNTASVSCSPTGFPNVLTASDGHSVNLFQPSVKVTKTGPAYSKAGDTAIYNVTIENTSSADSPDLVLDSFSDSLVAGVTPPASCSPLAPGASCTFSYTYIVQAGDPDPLVNTATAHYHPAGFPNDITNSSTYNTDMLHPSFTVTKACKAQPVSQAGPAVFTITFNNTGDADMRVVPSEGAAFDVAAGQSYSYDYSIAGPLSDTVNNTVTGTVTLASKYGLSNSYTFTASGSCIVEGKAKVVKTVSGQPPAAGQTFTFQLRQGASTTQIGTILEQKNTDASGNISFNTSLVPGQTYQLCEIVMPGWLTDLGTFVPNSFIPPDGVAPNPNVDNSILCVNFSVASGQTKVFTVDNTPPPGGRALTIGFWKNWASCANSNGKQAPVLDQTLAIASTSPNIGLVVSAQTMGSGWPIFGPTYYLILMGNPANPNLAPDCSRAVNLLNKSTATTGKKMASDPLFNMTAQLIGAQLNYFAGAGKNGATTTNIASAVLLDGKYKFNGDTYTPKLTAADASKANCLQTQLNNYNNDLPVSTCP